MEQTGLSLAYQDCVYRQHSKLSSSQEIGMQLRAFLGYETSSSMHPLHPSA